MIFCDLQNRWALKKGLVLSSQWRICLYHNPILPTKIDCVFLPQQWMDLELVDDWSDFRVLEQMLQVFFQEITHSNIFNFSFLLQLNQSLPCFQSDLCIVSAIYLEFRDSRPMDQDKIKVSTIEFFNDNVTCFLCLLVPLLSWAYFTGDKQSLSFNFHLFKSLSNFLLILIDTGCVNMDISILDRRFDTVDTIITLELICAIANDGYFPTSVKGQCRVRLKFLFLSFHMSQNEKKNNIIFDQKVTHLQDENDHLFLMPYELN